MIETKQKVALVLSGGGARGIAHIGVIEELEKRGYEISSIAGTSMGSLIGGAYASGTMQELKEWFYSLDRRRVFRLVDFTLSKQGLIKADKVLTRMKDFVPDTKIESLPIPYAAVAVDMTANKEVVFREGSLYHAMRSSIAIPSVLTPVREEHRLLVDGGVMNNIPTNHVCRSEGDIMIAVNVNAHIPMEKVVLTESEKNKERVYQKKLKEFTSHLFPHSSKSEEEHIGYFSLLSRTLDMMMIHMAEQSLAQNAPDLLIPVPRESCSLYDFYKAEHQVEMGRKMAGKALDTYSKTQ